MNRYMFPNRYGRATLATAALLVLAGGVDVLGQTDPHDDDLWYAATESAPMPAEVLTAPPELTPANGGQAAANQSELLDSIETLQEQLDDLNDKYDRLTRDEILRPRWNDRFEFRSYDGDFRLVLGARVEHDYTGYSTDDALEDVFGPIDGGSQFRRARLIAAARLYENLNFFSQYDFATGRARFASVFVEMSDVPALHNVRIGQFEEPLGLERLTSHRYLTFMERALTNAITPVRSTGVMLRDKTPDELGTWWIGYFRDANSVGFSQGDGGDAVTGRVTRLLAYSDEGRRLMHVGGAFSYRKPLDNTIRFRNRPESDLLSQRFVDTGDLDANDVTLLAAELAIVNGPLSLQGEYIYNRTGVVSGERLDFSAAYFNVSLLLTGEHRTYSRSSATFRRVEPHRNFSWSNGCIEGWGAWEVAARLSYVDLSDGSVDGGRETNGTLGVNWYWNPNVRTMFNFVYADRHDIGAARIFQTRFQVNF